MGNAAWETKWGFIDIVLVYILTVILTLLCTYIAVNNISDVVGYFTAGAVIQFFITIGLVFLFTIYKNKAVPADLGLKKASGQDLLLYGLVGGVLLMVLMILLGIPIAKLQPDVQPQVYEQILRSTGQNWQFLLLLFLGVFVAPVSEEIFYRGMIYPVVRGWLGPWWGAAAAGLLFGLAHWDLWRTIPLAIGGALLCYMYEKTGSILVTMLAHGTWNGLMALLVYLNIFVS